MMNALHLADELQVIVACETALVTARQIVESHDESGYIIAIVKLLQFVDPRRCVCVAEADVFRCLRCIHL